MNNGGYTGALPIRDDSPEAYSGVWDLEEQFTEVAAGRWAQTTAGIAPRSIRLNSADTAFFSRTPPSVGSSLTTGSISMWVKLSNFTTENYLFSVGSDTSDYFIISLNTSNQIRIFTGENGATNLNLTNTVAVFRDPSAWYHILVQLDWGNAVSSDRIKLFVNGNRVALSGTFAAQGYTGTRFNRAFPHYIGRHPTGAAYFNGYISTVHFIDGQALLPEAFGFFDGTGIWQPRRYRGTYGVNGFYLDFSDNSGATATTLGADRSGNGNNWTPIGLNVSNSSINPYTGAADYLDRALDGFAGSEPTPTTNVAYTATFVTPIPYNTLTIVYGNMANGQLGNPASGAVLSINGTPVSATGTYGTAPYNTTYHKYYSTSTPGTLTSLGMSAGIGGSHETGIFEVYVNGVPLKSARPSSNDSLFDSPVNGAQSDTGLGGQVQGNYCVLNPLQSSATLLDGNLQCFTTSTSWQASVGSFFQSTGKWYAEFTILNIGAGGIHIGIVGPNYSVATGNYIGNTSTSYAYRADGTKFTNTSQSSYGASYTSGDVIGVAMDLDAGTLVFYKNGVSQGTAYTGMTGEKAFAVSVGSTSGLHSVAANFGQRPFVHAAPSGFKVLCTANLPEPAIKRGDDFFQTVLYTGNGAAQTISGLRFSPDLAWIKVRNTTYWNELIDSVRGVGKTLFSNATDAESTLNTLTAFNQNGFTVSTQPGYNGTNESTRPYVAWCWDAGSSTVTNTQGSITSSVRANASAGFSIVTYSQGANNSTVGHGLGAAPHMIIAKSRTVAGARWDVFHRSLGREGYIYLDGTNAAATYPNYWGSVLPTSTTFGVSLAGNYNNTGNMVAYCFAPVAGYSSFGSYVGTANADGPMVWLGFRPRWILFKNTSVGVEDWWLHDTARNTYNVMTSLLVPNSANAEGTNAAHSVDALSNGFKIRTTAQGVNGSGHTIVYAAFAEAPFQYARAR